MKRITRLGIAVLMVLCIASMGSLTACSDSTSGSNGTSSVTTESSGSKDVGASGNSSSSGSATSSAPEAAQKPSTSNSGVTPSFKEAMDEYESFIDEYCDFMRKYMDSGYSASMLSDYTKWMGRYSTMMSKIEAVDSDSLSAADSAYYLEVMGRVNQKLASIL